VAFLQDDDQQTGDFAQPPNGWSTTGATAAAVAATAPLGGAVDDEVLRGPCPSRNLVLACQASVYL